MARQTRQTTQTTDQEVDTRAAILNTLLTTPHRDLDAVYPVHQKMMTDDPLFYVHLAAWYAHNGEIRDHKEMFAICLSLSDFPGHRDAGLALLRQLPPYQLNRVVTFVKGGKKKVRKEVPVTASTRGLSRGRGKGAQKRVSFVTEDTGLKRNTIPKSFRTEVSQYLRERENDPTWFDSCVLGSRNHMRDLYIKMRLQMGDRAKRILWDEDLPDDSRLAAVRDLQKAATPADQADIIVKYKIPYRIASTIITTAMTPTVVFALIEVMSDQELINNIGSLRKHGAFDNEDLKGVITKRLDEIKSSKKVSALKSEEAAKASGVTEDVQKQLKDVTDSQLKAKGRVKKPTALIIDKSGSMSVAIEIGKRMAALISTIMDAPFYVYAADTMPYAITARGDHAAWEKAFAGIRANGGTSCGAGIAMMTAQGQSVEQIIMVTDEGENSSPRFFTALEAYAKQFGMPHVIFLKCGNHHTFLEDMMQRAGYAFDTYEFDGDYYSLPGLIPFLSKPGKLELLMEIMSTTLPKRKGLLELQAV